VVGAARSVRRKPDQSEFESVLFIPSLEIYSLMAVFNREADAEEHDGPAVLCTMEL
jgi:hypothetical protein